MITFICGEDTISSRKYFIELKNTFKSRNVFIKDISPAEVFDINKWLGSSVGLFNDKTVFFTEELNKKINKKNQVLYDRLTLIAETKNIEIFVWENCSGRDIKLKTISIKEFKPSKNIFKLLDLVVPGNRKIFIGMLTEIISKDNDFFVFQMLIKHIRSLILVKEGLTAPKLASWQIAKLKALARSWKIENLVLFYQSLYKIEKGVKTSTTPFLLAKSLNILACYFL